MLVIMWFVVYRFRQRPLFKRTRRVYCTVWFDASSASPWPRSACQTIIIEEVAWLVFQKYVEVDAEVFPNRITIDPPLQIGRVPAVAVVIQPAVGVDFLARKTIHVSAG